jgi:RHS repeat-associated protein
MTKRRANLRFSKLASFLPIIFALFFSINLHATERPKILSGQTITLPGGPASLKGLGESFSPNIATGTGSYSIPIALPPALLQPDVTIQYTGGKGRSELGLGFKLPVLAIYRSTDKGVPRYTEDDRFSVEGGSLNDELVLVNDKERWYRLKNESAYALFIRDVKNDLWKIKLPSGDTLMLGQNLDSKLTIKGTAAKWYITKHTDLFGHAIEYIYFKDERRVYLKEITYQLHTDAQYRNSVQFEYYDRIDPFTDYIYGDAVTCRKQLSKINVFHGPYKIRRYEFSYQKDLIQSFLKSVRSFGAKNEPLPELTFEYEQLYTELGMAKEMHYLPPMHPLKEGGGAELEDVNGDGLPDVLYGISQGYYYYENIGGWSFGNRIDLADSPDQSFYYEGVLFADMNGDGKRDVAYRIDDDFRYYPAGEIKNGKFLGFGPPVTFKKSFTADFQFTSDFVKVVDLNYDGRIDILRKRPGEDDIILNLPGNELDQQPIEELPGDVKFDNPNVELNDFNGDGILDFVLKTVYDRQSSIRVWYGMGLGKYSDAISMQRAPEMPANRAEDLNLVDVNRDGYVDLIYISGSFVSYWLNNGQNSYTQEITYRVGYPSQEVTRRRFFIDMNGNGTTDIVWLTKDLELKYLDLQNPFYGLLNKIDNGMGAVTEIKYKSSTEYSIQAQEAGTPWSTSLRIPVPVIAELKTTDSMSKLGYAARQVVTKYDYYNGYYDGKEREFRGFAKVIATSVGDESHPTQLTEIRMHVGRNLKTGADEEVLKGKPYVEIVKDENGTIYTTAETTWEQRWLCQEDLKIATKILPECKYIAKIQENKDKLIAMGLPTASLSGTYEATNTPKWTLSLSKYNAWGVVEKKEAYGEVGLIKPRVYGEPIDLKDFNTSYGYEDDIYSITDYIYNIDAWLIGLPLISEVRDYKGNLYAKSRTFYDGPDFTGLEYGIVTQGKQAKVEVWYEDAKRWISKSRTAYNRDGLPRAQMDANGNVVDIDYDTETRSFPVKEKFTLESGTLETIATYNLAQGTITSVTDFNNNTTRFKYDGLGRLTRVYDPYATDETPSIIYEYTFGTRDKPISTTKIQTITKRNTDINNSTYKSSWIYSDGFGETRLTKTEAEQPFSYIGSGWKDYTKRNSVNRAYDPFSSWSEQFEKPGRTTPYTESKYDILGRVVELFPPSTAAYGRTSIITKYLPFETRVYDEQDTFYKDWSYPAITRIDGAGRVREIIKHKSYNGGPIPLRWRADYNPAGSLTKFTDPQGNARDYAYDSLQRLKAISDLNAGTVEYEYDDVGNIILRRDGLGQEQQYVYGKANRLKSVHLMHDWRGREDYSYAYAYDKPCGNLIDAKNLKGKLACVEWPTGSYQASYDKLNRVVHEKTGIWDGIYTDKEPTEADFRNQDYHHQYYTYNDAGQVATHKAPGNFVTNFEYNERQLVNQIRGGFEGKEIKTLFSGLQYDRRGLLTRTDFGNRTTTCTAYDDRSLVTTVKSGKTGGILCDEINRTSDQPFQHLNYERTPTGLISKIVDRTPIKKYEPRFDAEYTYDRLYQLTQTTLFRPVLENGVLDKKPVKTHFEYDNIQNLTRVIKDNDLMIAKGYEGEFEYTKNKEYGYGPNQISQVNLGDDIKASFHYNEIGQLMHYNEFHLEYDIEGRLVEATRWGNPGRKIVIRYYYDDTGARRLAIVEKDCKKKIYRYPYENYQIRNGDKTWIVKGGSGKLEISESKGLRATGNLVDEMIKYKNLPGQKKPLPEEYMDLDKDGKRVDDDDIEIALKSLAVLEPVGGPVEVRRWYHSDQLGGTTHTTDSVGDLVSYRLYQSYGENASKDGLDPTYVFAGAEIEVEQELGLIQFGARWYAPGVGRWISPDLLFLESPGANVGSVLESNLYSYAGNDPVNSKDPTGHGFEQIGLPVISAGEFAAGGALLLTGYALNQLAKTANSETLRQAADKVNAAGEKVVQAAEATIEKAATFYAANPARGVGCGGSPSACHIADNSTHRSEQKSNTSSGSTPGRPDPKPKQSTKKPEVKPENKSESEDNFEAGKLDQDQTTIKGTSGGPRAGKQFTPKGKREIDEANAKKNAGINKCENCGIKVVPGEKSQKGIAPPGNERQRDHIIPRSKGGDGDPPNGQILCRDCNIKKSDKT